MTPDPTSLLESLVAIDSTNPSLVPTGPGEAAIAQFTSDWLTNNGIEATLRPTNGIDRPNVVALLPGSGHGRKLLLNAHLDTVGGQAMSHPFQPRITNGRLYGRGALDTKGGLAAAMTAMAELRDRRPPGDVILTAVADEEYSSVGTTAVTGIEADAAIVYEPTDLQVVVSHKGFVWVDIDVKGTAAHGSRPDLGVDAITNAARILTELSTLNAVFAAAPVHTYLTPESIHASLIKGGQERSSYSESCTVAIEVRTHPGRPVAEIMGLIQDRIDGLASSNPDLRATATVVLERSGLDGGTDTKIARVLGTAVKEVTGLPSVYRGHDGWMDSALLADVGIPTVVFGPSGEGLHGAIEWVDLASVATCRDVTVRAAHLLGEA